MTQRQLDRAVAAATGESVVTIHRLGFVAQDALPADPEPGDLCLAVDCPFCRRPVPYPGLVVDGSAAMAECDRCDVYFDFDPGDVYAEAARHLPPTVPAVKSFGPIFDYE